MICNRWYNTIDMNHKWCAKSERAMNDWIVWGSKENGGALRGTMANLSGYPDDLTDWKHQSGMAPENLYQDSLDDTFFAGLDTDNQVDTTEEEVYDV
jgi:hypothetical protein